MKYAILITVTQDGQGYVACLRDFAGYKVTAPTMTEAQRLLEKMVPHFFNEHRMEEVLFPAPSPHDPADGPVVHLETGQQLRIGLYNQLLHTAEVVQAVAGSEPYSDLFDFTKPFSLADALTLLEMSGLTLDISKVAVVLRVD